MHFLMSKIYNYVQSWFKLWSDNEVTGMATQSIQYYAPSSWMDPDLNLITL